MTQPSTGFTGTTKFLKRLVDVVLSLIVIVLTAPIIVVTSIAIFLTDFGPVFYRQKRVGLNGREFDVLKFRSMRINNADIATMGKVETDHPLITSVGRMMRRTKIDELPQVLNVLLGDMSLVGPRPTIPEQVRKYDEYQWRRLLVRPGMTGWAQVNGGIELSWPERIALDIWYVDHWTWGLEIQIYIQTFAVIFFGERRKNEALQRALEYEGRVCRRT